MNAKKFDSKMILIIILGLVVVVLACYILVSKFAPEVSTEKTGEPQKVEVLNKVDLFSFKNGQLVKSALEAQAKQNGIYKYKWTRVVKANLSDKEIYFGQLVDEYGNGVSSDNRIPIFVIDGTVYYPYGYGGQAYELKDSNWKFRYKILQLNWYTPVRQTLYPLTQPTVSEIDSIHRITDVEQLTANLTIDGVVESLSIKLKSTGTEVSVTNDSLVKYEDQQLVTVNENSYSKEPGNPMTETRKLPGVITDSEVYENNFGLIIKYPKKINGLNVIRANQNEGWDILSTGDQEYDPDQVTIYCSNYSSNQVGPKYGDFPPGFSSGDIELIKDWGIARSFHADTLSFTGPNQNCTITASGYFTLDMLSIRFK